MATLEDLQQQLQLLQERIDKLTTPPNEYYTLLYSGEEVDERLGREGGGTVKTVAGVGPDDDGNVPLTASSVKAAPDGFGLGDSAVLLTSADDVNSIWKCGWYKFVSENVPKNAVVLSYLNLLRVESAANSVFMQTIYGMADNDSYQITPSAQRCIYGSKITPFEYINPPMILGVEYRTTERWDGKPVYAKLVDCGNMPNKTSKTVSDVFTNMKDICLLVGSMRTGSAGGFFAVNDQVLVNNNATGIQITTTEDYSAWTLRVLVKYTKTTD